MEREKEEKIFAEEFFGEILEEEKKEEKTDSENEDSLIFEKLAEIRGISKEEMKNEILWALEKAEKEKAVGEILEENPGMSRKTAEELFEFRKREKKPKVKEEKNKGKERLSELDEFIAKHSGEAIETLAKSVVEDWEGGIPLEVAFERYSAIKEKKELFEELEKLKNEKAKEEQKKYAKEFGPESAVSSGGIFGADEFAEGLFKEY